VTEFNVYGIALIPVIVGLSELLKKSGLPAKFVPVASLILGLIFGITYMAPGELKRGILLGLVLGLSSVGLFSGTKNTIFEGVRKKGIKKK